jgi:hypothetical protein
MAAAFAVARLDSMDSVSQAARRGIEESRNRGIEDIEDAEDVEEPGAPGSRPFARGIGDNLRGEAPADGGAAALGDD